MIRLICHLMLNAVFSYVNFRETVFRNMTDDSADDFAAYVEFLLRKLLTAIFLYYDIESA